MRKTLKTIFVIIAIICVVFISIFVYCLIASSEASLDENKLVNLKRTVTYYYSNGEIMLEQSNGITVTPVDEIPIYTKNAFIAIEDKRFYKHNGIDVKRLISAGINNLKSHSFKEGASTITQQLIKNTHLSGEKTIKRKVTEIKLAKKMEKKYDKEQILEKYLNTIYFGDNCYGITSASKNYFNKLPSQLDVNESAILAAIIKAPSYYSPKASIEKCISRKNLVLEKMYEQDYITKSEYDENLKKGVDYIENSSDSEKVSKSCINQIKKEFNDKIEVIPYSRCDYDVYTTIDSELQSIIEDEIKENTDKCDKSIILIDKDGKVKAYYTTIIDQPRQLGSVIKPLLVYAPAIEENTVESFTKINDEKVDFSGYSPSNYNDIYYGDVTVKESLARSLNTCAVKILNYVGIDKATEYLNKTDVKLCENDNSLCLALGASEKGSTLKEITSSYNVFLNDGSYNSAYFIESVKCNNANVYRAENKKNQVFNEDTISIVNDMMKASVSDGTAKKLSFTNLPLYAKTGTVGTSSGNTDAYTISYTNEFVLGCRFSNFDGELLKNSLTGGAAPCIVSGQIWEKVYKNKNLASEIKISNKVGIVNIDKISYEEDDLIIIADELSPKRFVLSVMMKNSNIPKDKSTRFSYPTIKEPKLIVKQNEINIELCLTELIDVRIEKLINNQKEVVFDTNKNKKSIYIDKNVSPNTEYVYLVTPYFKASDGNEYLGKEIRIHTKKTPSVELDDDWWLDDI